ncbi:MAG TPA: hypothetical protein VFK69_02415 [Candidatus Eisenbacteria bacterium]|nr:hypothetical protein [Candidatus Eisenbacteria bacterium]
MSPQAVWRERALWMTATAVLATSFVWSVGLVAALALVPPPAIHATFVVTRALGHALLGLAPRGHAVLPMFAPGLVQMVRSAGSLAEVRHG